MFERISERWRNEASGAMRLLALAAACVATATVTLSFLCAAAFVVALNRYGLVDACLVGAAVFLAATLILLATYAILAGRRRQQANARAALEQPPSPLADPRLILLGLQIVQAIGIKRILPLLAIGGAAFAIASSRSTARRSGQPSSARYELRGQAI